MQEVEQEMMAASAAAAARPAQRPAAAVMDGAGLDAQEGGDVADSVESDDSAGTVQEAGCDEAAAAAASSIDQGDLDAAIARLEAVTSGRRRPGL